MSGLGSGFTDIRKDGARLYAGFLSVDAQNALIKDLRTRLKTAPFYTPTMPRTGKPFTAQMTNLGAIGWVSDRSGYRYQAEHPKTMAPWPDLPEELLSIWRSVTQTAAVPDACAVNFYTETAKMGLHRDEDELDFSQPIVSVSLGDSCRFRLGGPNRNDKTQSFKLNSGDVLVLCGQDRLAYHGVDRIYAGSSTLLPRGGRINLTMRVAR